mmetsp:Transcript_65436/g.188251  ORF Transcript_65436/g.188251 Transcript_65436/m.188251 type:complete len:225 (+) Transcript_65436:486-1160(+)
MLDGLQFHLLLPGQLHDQTSGHLCASGSALSPHCRLKEGGHGERHVLGREGVARPNLHKGSVRLVAGLQQGFHLLRIADAHGPAASAPGSRLLLRLRVGLRLRLGPGRLCFLLWHCLLDSIHHLLCHFSPFLEAGLGLLLAPICASMSVAGRGPGRRAPELFCHLRQVLGLDALHKLCGDEVERLGFLRLVQRRPLVQQLPDQGLHFPHLHNLLVLQGLIRDCP